MGCLLGEALLLEEAVQTVQGTELQGFDSVGFFPDHARNRRHVISQNQSADQHLALLFSQRIDRPDHRVPFIVCLGSRRRVLARMTPEKRAQADSETRKSAARVQRSN